MKLLYCIACQDIIRLRLSETHRYCECGKSWGRYRTGRIAEVGGKGRIIGIHNIQFSKALVPNPDTRFEAWFIQEPAESVRRINSIESSGVMQEQLEYPRMRNLPTEEQAPFAYWMRDQTRPVVEGIRMDEQDFFYPWDYERWKEQGRPTEQIAGDED
ncbi:MAG: hypothetical protein IT446_04785 [Phycisphaerales bacterium]|nr:hypothetical protein [Phycisphaerales bacterium]